MTLGPGVMLRRVLFGMCFVQVAITAYLALAIFNSAYSSVANVKSFPQRPKSEAAEKASKKSPAGEFHIKANEELIVKAHHDVKPHIAHNLEVKWDDSKQETLLASVELPVVEIWGKAAIGSYLWQHILEGQESLDESMPGATVGELRMPAFTLRYRSGPGVVQETVPHDIKYLVLVANGRTPEKVLDVKQWLNDLKMWDEPPRTMLVMLGNEKCDNTWLQNYIHPKGPVVSVLLTYDDSMVDDKVFYQWPLGVATYRQFPVIEDDQVSPENPRKFVCNLRATLHPNTSRISLHKLLKDDTFAVNNCFISVREKWLPNETPESMNDYVWSLLQSDLTLCPAGMNTETYRVYEALSAGSTPVIEEVTTSGKCDGSPWRLVKKHGPPAIWVKTWDQLPKILAKERRYSKQYKALRRLRVFQWYEWFKLKMRDRFISIISSNLL